MNPSAPIGVFDSGMGGLTVLKALMDHLPHEDFIYLGDNARVPYGNKGRETVVKYSLEIGLFLRLQEIKLLVVACNTASAHALPYLRRRLPIPVIGVIDPACDWINANPAIRSCAILATRGTIVSQVYEQKLLMALTPIPCPLFVALVEEGETRSEAARLIVQNALKPITERTVDAVLLGCTHFPLLSPLIAEALPYRPLIIDSAGPCAQAVKHRLEKRRLLNPKSALGTQVYFTTDDTDLFAQKGSQFIQRPMRDITFVDVAGYERPKKGRRRLLGIRPRLPRSATGIPPTPPPHKSEHSPT